MTPIRSPRVCVTGCNLSVVVEVKRRRRRLSFSRHLSPVPGRSFRPSSYRLLPSPLPVRCRSAAGAPAGAPANPPSGPPPIAYRSSAGLLPVSCRSPAGLLPVNWQGLGCCCSPRAPLSSARNLRHSWPMKSPADRQGGMLSEGGGRGGEGRVEVGYWDSWQRFLRCAPLPSLPRSSAADGFSETHSRFIFGIETHFSLSLFLLLLLFSLF